MKAARLAWVLLLAANPVFSAAPKAAAKTASQARSVVPFIQDDYDKALAAARARKVPLFIDAWAPW